ncbi:MAG: HEPN domain-containing protein [Oscillospiraceae bacterium]|nr:HEPN domain-containing protein [Oscillospiraceae bacterium]
MTEEIRQWLAKSTDDIENAQFLFDNRWPQPFELICFLCQQCAEKSMKAFLIHCNVEFPYTHDLRWLYKLCMKHSGAFEPFLDACQVLTPYAIDAKYPNQLEVDLPAATYALANAREIFNTAVAAITDE